MKLIIFFVTTYLYFRFNINQLYNKSFEFKHLFKLCIYLSLIYLFIYLFIIYCQSDFDIVLLELKLSTFKAQSF